MSLAVGDFLAIGQVAWILYRDCIAIARGAPQEFKLLVEELKTLHMVMKSFDEEFKNPDSVLVRSGEDRHKMIGEILTRLNETLDTLTDIFRKHRNLGSTVRSGVKRTWDKFKWTLDAKEVDGLRSKLSYHNGVLGLLLACAGNSSLQRIEATTRSIDDGLQQLKTFLRHSTMGTFQSTSTPTPSAPLASAYTLDDLARLNFSAKCMKAAEVSQRWLAIGIDDWIKAGRWWLLRANAELQNILTGPNGEKIVSEEGYLNLLKASWILTDVIAVHPQCGLIEPSIQYEVMQLTQAINQEFKRIEDLNVKFPALSTLQDIVIWERYSESPTPKFESQGQIGRAWIMEDEMILYQNFGNYHPHDHTNPLTVCISVVVNSNSNQARLVFHDQSWRLLFKIQVSSLFSRDINEINMENTNIIIAKQKVILPTTRDAILLRAILVLYGRYHRILTGLPDPVMLYRNAFIFLIALKMDKGEGPKTLRHLAQMNQFEQLYRNPQHKDQAFLREVGMILSTINLEDHEAVRALTISNNLSQKRGEFQKYEYSVLGWVLYHHYDVGREWAHLHQKTSRLEAESLQDLLLPQSAVTQGNYELLKLWLATGLDPIIEQDILFSATSGGNLAIIQLLLEYGGISFADQFSDARMTIVHLVAQAGHEGAIAWMIESGAQIECQAKDKWRPLHHAARNGREGVVRLLLDRGAEIECQEGDQWRPLHHAAGKGHEGVVRLLLNRGAQIECHEKDQARPLHLAARSGHEDVVRLLLDRGAQIECQEKDQSRPLHIAARSGYEGIVRLLLDRGAEIECQAEDQSRPLHLAARNGHEGIVRLLLDRGAGIEYQCQRKKQWRPLHLAALKGHEDVVRLLLDCGAEIECQGDNNRFRPLHLAALNGHEGVVRLLLDRRARIECQTKDQWRPLHYAVLEGHEGVVRLLLDRGAQIECQEGNGWMPLHVVALNGHEGVGGLLLDRGAQIERQQGDNRRPLHIAAQSGHEGFVRLLLDRGAQIECPEGTQEWRPLHIAALRGHEGVVRALLDHRAKVDALNSLSQTPLDMAKLHFASEHVIKLLEDRMSQGAGNNT